MKFRKTSVEFEASYLIWITGGFFRRDNKVGKSYYEKRKQGS